MFGQEDLVSDLEKCDRPGEFGVRPLGFCSVRRTLSQIFRITFGQDDLVLDFYDYVRSEGHWVQTFRVTIGQSGFLPDF